MPTKIYFLKFNINHKMFIKIQTISEILTGWVPLVASFHDVVCESVEDCRSVDLQFLPDLLRDEHPIAVLDLVNDLLQLINLVPSFLVILLRFQFEPVFLILNIRNHYFEKSHSKFVRNINKIQFYKI